MDSILGLPDFAAFKKQGAVRTSHRRRILHSFPNGGSPLTGILSMLKTEPVDSVEHTWYEKRYVPARTTLRGTNPITSTAPVETSGGAGDEGDADTGTNSTGTVTTATALYIKLGSTERIAPGHLLMLENGYIYRVVSVVRGFADPAVNGFVKVQAQRGYTVAGTEDVAGKQIVVVGSAHGEGALGSGLKPTGVRMPIALTNQTQISRTFFTFPGTVLQQGLEFDKTGPYAEKAYDTAIDHMVEIEMNVLFGKRSTTVRDELDASSDEDQTVRTMSGIIEFLELWDAGSTGILVDGVTYAPFAKLGAAATLDTDDRKRIITNAGGVVTVDLWNQWAERVGRYHTNRTSEKLVLCGSGALNAMHKMFRRETCFNVSPNQKAYGLDFTTLNTPYGLYHFTMHPLLNENSLWRNWAFILDIHSMRLRPLRNRDTKLLKNRHNPGDDRRKDEFLTEYMLELHFAENNMLIKNLYDYSAS